jgi:hypothetical protein
LERGGQRGIRVMRQQQRRVDIEEVAKYLPPPTWSQVTADPMSHRTGRTTSRDLALGTAAARDHGGGSRPSLAALFKAFTQCDCSL